MSTTEEPDYESIDEMLGRELIQRILHSANSQFIRVEIENGPSRPEIGSSDHSGRVKGLNVSLRKEQCQCMRDMFDMEHQDMRDLSWNLRLMSRMGFNTNPDGFGKKLVVLALACNDANQTSKEEYYMEESCSVSSGNLLVALRRRRLTRLQATLVLVSHAALSAWETELTTKTDLRWISVVRASQVDTLDPERYNVVLVVPSVWNLLCATTRDQAWSRFVYDEPVYTKVSRMHWCSAVFYWFFTTDPEKMRAQHWNARRSMMQDICGNDSIPQNSEEFRKICVYNVPAINGEFLEPSHIVHQCQQHLFSLLEGVVSPWVHQIIAAADFPMAVLELVGKASKSDPQTQSANMIEMVSEHITQKVARLNLRLIETEDDGILEMLNSEKEQLLRQLLRLKDRTEKLFRECCPICMDVFKQPVIDRHCQHIFCQKCLFACLPKCPMCRTQLNVQTDISEIRPIQVPMGDLSTLSKQTEDLQMTSQELKRSINPTPETRVIQIIQNKSETSKFVVYSNFRFGLHALIQLLADADIPYIMMRGNTNNQQKLLKQFQSENISVLLVENASSYIGIQLPLATDLIFYHKMSQYLENKLIHNSSDPTRNTPLYVHHLER